MGNGQSQAKTRISTGTWVLGGGLTLILVYTFFFGPEELPPAKHKMLGLFCAAAAGMFSILFAGDVSLSSDKLKTIFGNIKIRATGGFAIFVFVMLWWQSPLTPISAEIEGLAERVARLEEQLALTDPQINNWQDPQINNGQDSSVMVGVPYPSDSAVVLAGLIPDNADPYARALKAIAEGRYDDARDLLNQTQQEEEGELSKIYQAKGLTELYAWDIPEAFKWYKKAVPLDSDNPKLLNTAGVLAFRLDSTAIADRYLNTSLDIRENTLQSDDPDLAVSLNNVAVLLEAQGRIDEAKPLMKRAVSIDQQTGDSGDSGDPDRSIRALNLQHLQRAAGGSNATDTESSRTNGGSVTDLSGMSRMILDTAALRTNIPAVLRRIVIPTDTTAIPSTVRDTRINEGPR